MKYTIHGSVSTFIKKVKTSIILVCLFQGSRVLKSYQIDKVSLHCLKMFNGMNSLEQIAKKNRLTIQDVQTFANFLKKEGIICPKSKRPLSSKFRRQLNFFDSYETKTLKAINYQERLESARVLIVGLGGIGSWILESLVRAGVGTIKIIDPDIVTLNNIPRQSLYDETDIGRTKIKAAIRKCLLINSKLNIKGYRLRISKIRQLLVLSKDMTLVINCADQPDISITNNLISKTCHRFKVPHILCGGYDGHLSFIGLTVIPEETACWQCFVNDENHNKALKNYKHLAITKNNEEGGTLVSIAAITANIHALEAIKVISGYTKPTMANYKAEIDFNTLRITRTRILKRPSCLRCGGGR